MIFGKNFSKRLFSFLVLFFIGQMAATYYSLYWHLPWFDNLMHFLGGFFIAMAIIWWSLKRINLNYLPPFFTIIVILGFVALVGVFWEFYELGVDRLITKNNYIKLLQQGSLLDTLKDLLVDLLGGLTAGLIFLYERKKRK